MNSRIPPLLEKGGYRLIELSTFNFIVGKNGVGKSRLLRALDVAITDNEKEFRARYISPERAGHLLYESGIDNIVVNHSGNLRAQMRANQYGSFRQQSFSRFRQIERMVRIKLEKAVLDNLPRTELVKMTFDKYFTLLNSLLDNIKLAQSTTDPAFVVTSTDEKKVEAGEISSGEAELISLGIETLAFALELDSNKTNLLLLDSPDVHLHPDLQCRFMNFLYE